MSRRAWAATALLGLGLLLLATTQPWVRTVTEVAPGAPRTRGAVGASELVPWLAPVALVAALALVLALARVRVAGPVAVAAALATLAGAGTGALGATASSGAAVVSADRTGWLWVGCAAALLAAAGALLWWRGPDPAVRPRSPRPPRDDDPDGTEAVRRRDAQDWRDLSEGRDPTQG